MYSGKTGLHLPCPQSPIPSPVNNCRSLSWPIFLGVVMIVLVVALIVGWVIVTMAAPVVASNRALYITMLALGTTFLALLLLGVVTYLFLSIKAIRLNQRQSNFIDSVTHELKSPLAALKLCLQTLERRQLSPEQQSEFYGFMVEDLQRLHNLIDHLLDAARLDQKPLERDAEDIELAALLERCAATMSQRYRLPPDAIRRELTPAWVRARPADLEMVFRNLLDNAVKYAGDQPEVNIDLHSNGDGQVMVRISDNGPGIPPPLRRKIFGRFVRLGNELERAKPGTGLGLYIVRTLVRRMHGKVTVRGRDNEPGTIFEVALPAREHRGEV
jgi:two-component system, OmpR family, phosphate regulon sensor histidine kinase PhoR